MTRIGLGYDIHRLVTGRKLVLGGETIPYEKGLLGHSDADVLVHAVCDALLGAAGLGETWARHQGSAAKCEREPARHQCPEGYFAECLVHNQTRSVKVTGTTWHTRDT